MSEDPAVSGSLKEEKIVFPWGRASYPVRLRPRLAVWKQLCCFPSLPHFPPPLTWDGVLHSLSLTQMLFTQQATFSFHFVLCHLGSFCTFLLIPSELPTPADVTQLQLETLSLLIVSFK